MPHPSRVLVVDDDPAVCAFLRDFLIARGDEAITATTGDEALRRFAEAPPAVVLLDVVLPGSRDGLSTLTAFRQLDRQVPVIVISGLGRTATIVQAITLGAADVLPKPLGEAELTRALDTVLTRQAMRRELVEARNELTQEPLPLPLVGDSDSIRGLRALVSRLGDQSDPVLIRGERGTGKAAVARVLHEVSGRRGGFVTVNGATAPRDRIEIELFGLARDGTSMPRPGAVDFAREGTMFLREVADVPADVQRRLLQLMQDGTVLRSGGRTPVAADVRLIASTHRDLEAAAAEGNTREDLCSRLAANAVTVPPLRERPGDIVPLATRLLRQHAVRCHRRPPSPGDRFLAALERLDWPGNIRQMDAAMRQLVITGDEAAVLRGLERSVSSVHRIVPATPTRPASPTPGDEPVGGVPAEGADRAGVSLKDIARSAAREAERELILQMLTRTRWNRKEAAEFLGISYKALLYKIKENGLDKAS